MKMEMKAKINIAKMKIKNHSPEILMVTGVVATTTATVLACRSTLKAQTIIADHKANLDAVNEALALETPEYTEADAKKDAVISTVQTTGKIIKAYAIPATLYVGGMYCFFKAKNVLTDRNINLAAAYAGLDQTFKAYRSRVAERYGADIEHDIKCGINRGEVEVTTVDKKGKEKTTIEKTEWIDSNGFSVFSRMFDDGTPGWTKDPHVNKGYLQGQQSYLNDLLKIQHFVLLNDVYEMLGFEKTGYGCEIGWLYDPDNITGLNCANVIDFGYFKNEDFVNCRERSVLLDFNPDGAITSYMDDVIKYYSNKKYCD